VTELVVIFRTHSDIEAQIVRGLLEAHGVMSVVSSDVLHSVFPMSVDGLTEVRIAVHAAEAADAQRIIDGHRTELKNGEVVRLRDEFGPLQQDILFRDFPEFDEGQKSKTKASLVSTAALARQAERLGLGDHLLLGRGEEKTGGRRKQALLADGYEALIAAIYLDGGIEPSRAFIIREFGPHLDEVRRHGVGAEDYKSTLQEWLQSRDMPLPEYRLAGSLGPDHRKLFEIEVMVRGERVASGSGPSKKEAEQDAARATLDKLRGPV
jgi:ribonuclease-3